MICQSCNGWGVVLRLGQTPPPTREHRDKLLRKLRDDHTLGKQVKVGVCLGCLGYGRKPERTTGE
jgi:hypothetical protein